MSLRNMLERIYEHKYTLTPSKKSIAQTERNELKYELTDVIKEVLEIESEDMDLLITRTIDGYIMEVENRELGMIPIELVIKVRNLDYDIYGQEQAFLDKNKE